MEEQDEGELRSAGALGKRVVLQGRGITVLIETKGGASCLPLGQMVSRSISPCIIYLSIISCVSISNECAQPACSQQLAAAQSFCIS
jgi:hypothetical protein